jgi:hypothetical protein
VVKKKLLEQEIVLDEIKFMPQVGIEGFRIISSFDITKLSCDQFSNEVHQMAIILYPTDAFNEKFLIKVRNCVVKLKEGHPLKQWLNRVAKPDSTLAANQEDITFLNEVINSQFNLITDLKMKEKIILKISSIPDNSLPEKLLRSFLYLMLGNVSRSDNILREITARPPFINWQGYSGIKSDYHKLARNNLNKILQKIFNHPADRRSAELLGLYFTSFFNDPQLIEMITDLKSGSLDGAELSLRYVERISPSFVHYLRFTRFSDERRIKNLRDLERFPLSEQAYWDWAFLDIDPLISDHMLQELNTIEKQDKLWFIYLMDNEKLSDWYIAKMHRSFLTGKRQFLRSQLEEKSLFMLSLFKLIQSGDIDAELIKQAATFLAHD